MKKKKKRAVHIFLKSLCFFMGIFTLIISVYLFVWCSTYGGGFWVGIVAKFPVAFIAFANFITSIIYFTLGSFMK